MASPTAPFLGGYFCEHHRPATAIAIPDDAIFRRVRFTLDVLMGAAAWDKAVAHAEGIRRLERAITLVGAYIDTRYVSSEIGSAAPQALALGVGLDLDRGE